MTLTTIEILKLVSAFFFILALIYSVRNYKRTNERSKIWMYVSLAMACAVILTLIRTTKEFWFYPELEIIKVELIPFLMPLLMLFLIAASITVKRETNVPITAPLIKGVPNKKR